MSRTIEQLEQRFGRDTINILAMTSASFVAGESSASDFYDFAFDVLLGDFEAVSSFVSLLPPAKRDAVLALRAASSRTADDSALPQPLLAPALAPAPSPMPNRAQPDQQQRRPPPPFGRSQGRPQSAPQVAGGRGRGFGPVLPVPPCSLVRGPPGGVAVGAPAQQDRAQPSGLAGLGTAARASPASWAAGTTPASSLRPTFSPTGRHKARPASSATASATGPPQATAAAVSQPSGAPPSDCCAPPCPRPCAVSAADWRRLRRLQQGDRAPAPVLVWLRSDLRIADNPALLEAAKLGPVIPVFVYAPQEEGGYPLGGAARLWLHHSLYALSEDLKERFGSRLVIRNAAGSSSAETLLRVASETGADALFSNRVYEPWKVDRDESVRSAAAAAGVHCESFCAGVLYEPWDARPDADDDALWNGGYGSVGFFLRAVERLGPPPEPVPAPSRLRAPLVWPQSEPLSALALVVVPRNKSTGKPIDWPAGIREAWGFGEGAAHAALQRFVSDSGALLAFDSKRVQVEGEAATSARFRADRTGTARLSPYLRFGELSPRQVYARCVEAAAAAYKRGGGGGKGQPGGAEAARSARAFLRRLAWRDLFYWALWRFPKLPWEPLRPHYSTQWWDLRWCETDDPERALAVTSARRRWAPEHAGLRAWQRGETGYPLASAHTHPDPHPHILQGESAMVDAAMRELWHTGWIPNYLRHVVASFLIEYLAIDWRHGALWFSETLVDADVAINAAMWQNGGHSGLDQWNFVMHPVNAAKSADPDGHYVRKWCPELSKLKGAYVHAPWDAPATARAAAGVILGRTYPRPIVADLDAALKRSLHAVNAVREGPGKACLLPDGNEALELPCGRRARLITRVDFRVGAQDPVTRQTAAAEWDPRRRTLGEDAMARALREEVALSSRNGGGGRDDLGL